MTIQLNPYQEPIIIQAEIGTATPTARTRCSITRWQPCANRQPRSLVQLFRALLSFGCLVSMFLGCSSGIPWGARVIEPSLHFPSLDGSYKIKIEYEDSRGFAGNPNLT